MGLGGYLAWTAVAREVHKKFSGEFKILPCEGHGKTITKIVESEVFKYNPIISNGDEPEGTKVFPLFVNNPQANYCKQDTPNRAFHRHDKHIIEGMCEVYGIENPKLKCEMYFTDGEREEVQKIISNLEEDYIVIEPYSKTNYTPNRAYPIQSWQNLVNDLSEYIQIVQVGLPSYPLLKNVTDMRGKTTFRSATLLIEGSELFMSTEGGLVHAATAVDTTSLVVITGYQTSKMVAYPQNINVHIGTHGPCGLKIPCLDCKRDAAGHDYLELLGKATKHLAG
mgnify:CR=1 FL=1